MQQSLRLRSIDPNDKWKCHCCGLVNFNNTNVCKACFRVKILGEFDAEIGIPFKYNYIPSNSSLKTTDECCQYSLLPMVDLHSPHLCNQQSKLVFCKNDIVNQQILSKIDNILFREECNIIISRADELNAFQNMNKSKYNPEIRKSDRVLVIDTDLSL